MIIENGRNIFAKDNVVGETKSGEIIMGAYTDMQRRRLRILLGLSLIKLNSTYLYDETLKLLEEDSTLSPEDALIDLSLATALELVPHVTKDMPDIRRKFENDLRFGFKLIHERLDPSNQTTVLTSDSEFVYKNVPVFDGKPAVHVCPAINFARVFMVRAIPAILRINNQRVR